jgi:selenocysteine lyase/cysteine desulfurase
MHRRSLLRLVASAGAGLAVSSLSAGGASPPLGLQAAPELPDLTPARAAGDEAFWAQVRALYAPDASLLDLDHGNSGAVPTAVIDAYLQRARQLNRAPNAHYPLLSGGEALYERIASWLGASLDVIALLPNATTGLNTVLHGFPLQRGDEVLVTDHEYPDMVETLHQRAVRDGIVIRTVRVPSVDAPAGAMVDAVRGALTPATKLLLVSHMSAWNGEVLPVAAISALCRARGVAVLVDAAQSVGHLPIAFDTWGCDFLALSFHKAAGAPLATGALLMRREWIGRVAPLHPPTWDYGPYPIDQYAWIGTTNVAAHAIALQERIGLARKRARLMYLASYWHARARDIRGFRVLTPQQPERHIGYSSFAIAGVPSKVVAKRLRDDFQIQVQDKASRPYRPYDNAVRVTAQPYTSLAELDRFVTALREVARA